jgi:hypothetical protein
LPTSEIRSQKENAIPFGLALILKFSDEDVPPSGNISAIFNQGQAWICQTSTAWQGDKIQIGDFYRFFK